MEQAKFNQLVRRFARATAVTERIGVTLKEFILPIVDQYAKITGQTGGWSKRGRDACHYGIEISISHRIELDNTWIPSGIIVEGRWYDNKSDAYIEMPVKWLFEDLSELEAEVALAASVSAEAKAAQDRVPR